MTVHMSPTGDSNRLACCGIPAGERKMDRVTNDPALVTCRFWLAAAGERADR